ncbi:sigma-54 dependent transcriptional regulator [Aquabacterium sp. A7-Y]|uniref:sigma-54-dependent transcriptional regulator n=1 Tax=Aquabacterium sp. A7-Y TaxID=1349605 RepID=UPI00223DE54E|nr:sigma-54 dependent transcriptional regulator [Aquabacterium sp. A7-Y]MCW7541563.1 sigma-54 dependent transcriptional regulator [Aquabacterium sp. A7-Y]
MSFAPEPGQAGTACPALPPEGCHVLLAEDDKDFSRILSESLSDEGFKVSAFRQPREAVARLTLLQPDVVLTDMMMPGMSGLEVLAECQSQDPELPVIVLSARGNIPIAIEAIRKGAYDFLEKPFPIEKLVSLLRRAWQQRRLATENRCLKGRLAEALGIASVIRGESPAVRELREAILRIAPAPVDVLVLGETGTGKELVARSLHQFGTRKGPFVAINCAAIPDTLFESELFGHEAGAYTGATKARVGKIEYASGGTLFLDEIEALPLQLQAKLLRVLQERQVERLGSNRSIPVDLRVVAATKVDLKALSEAGRFRLDLVYRLNVAPLRNPALRERREDIPALFAHFLQEAALRFDQPVAGCGPELMQALFAYDWPGNVRELRNVAEQVQLGIQPALGQPLAGGGERLLDNTLSSVEKGLIEDALRRAGGSAGEACKALGINYSALYRKMKAHNIDLARFRRSG